MKRNRWILRSHILVLALGVEFLAACDQAVEPKQGEEVVEEKNVLADARAGIHPVLVLASHADGAATIEVYLKEVGGQTPIASFQGELEYDAAVLTLSRAELPEGITGAWNEVAPGKLRFAGVTADGIGARPVLVLHVAPKTAITGQAFSLRMEEVVSANDLSDLTSRVVTQDHPHFSTTPLR